MRRWKSVLWSSLFPSLLFSFSLAKAWGLPAECARAEVERRDRMLARREEENAKVPTMERSEATNRNGGEKTGQETQPLPSPPTPPYISSTPPSSPRSPPRSPARPPSRAGSTPTASATAFGPSCSGTRSSSSQPARGAGRRRGRSSSRRSRSSRWTRGSRRRGRRERERERKICTSAFCVVRSRVCIIMEERKRGKSLCLRIKVKT